MLRSLLPGALAILACLQTVAGFQQTPVFRAGTRVVPVYVTVTGPDGHLLTDLTQDDFQVYEDGERREIAAFSTDPGPITGLALWDVSREMRDVGDRSRSSARSLVAALWPADRLRFGSFSSWEFALSPLLTGDKPTLLRVIDEELWFTLNYPILWSAVMDGLQRLSQDAGRRVLIVTTAGRSTGERRSRGDAVTLMHQTDTQVYAVGFEQPGLSNGMKDMAAESGGGYVVIGPSDDLDRAWAGILDELHHQYLLGFAPSAVDAQRHEIRVTTTVAGARVRFRRAHMGNVP
ncbi:MAG: VWA domain-containing protein [Vicinamibacterales bacterium]